MATVATLETVETDETSDDDSSLDNAGDYIDGMEDFFGEDAPGSYWLSDDQLAELMVRGPTNGGAGTVKIPPPLLDWTLQDPHKKPMQVTFGKARRSLWEQFKKEHGLFISNVKKLETPADCIGAILTPTGAERMVVAAVFSCTAQPSQQNPQIRRKKIFDSLVVCARQRRPFTVQSVRIGCAVAAKVSI